MDCDFTYNEEDIESLELKWYFRHDPTPIYTWVPPNEPQVNISEKNILRGPERVSQPVRQGSVIHIS